MCKVLPFPFSNTSQFLQTADISLIHLFNDGGVGLFPHSAITFMVPE